ncbi:MAG: redoxin family protein, partial [Pseudomonadota bacterium]
KTCTGAHFPGYLDNYPTFQRAGVDTVACLATNDHAVMDAWSESMNNKENSILMLSDGNAEFAQMTETVLDLRSMGMGLRSQRYAIIIEDRLVRHVGVDNSGLDKSSAESILAHL